MNKLSYGLLSFLATESQTGYDLVIRLNQFWRTTHSAIYPLLSELEEEGYVKYKLVEQTCKPDKKIYTITTQGMEALKKWISSTTDTAVVRDEMMLKMFCIQVLDRKTVEALLDEIQEKYHNLLNKYLESLEKLKNKINSDLKPTNPPIFGGYVLLQKAISETKLGIKWCNWVRSLYEDNQKINFFDSDFFDAVDKAP